MHSKTIIFVVLCVYGFVTSVESKPFRTDVPEETSLNNDYLPKKFHIQKIGRKDTAIIDDLENPIFSEHNENGISDEDLNSFPSINTNRVGFGHLLKALAIWNAAREYNLYGNKKFIPNTDTQQALITSA